MKVVVATDGSTRWNPDGPGGWAAVYGDGREIHGGHPCTTNNRMELQAVIEGLRQIPEPSDVIVHCDSQYVVYGITRWMPGWKKKNWRSVKNREFWVALDKEVKRHLSVEFKWVRGHNGHAGNERADLLAGEAARMAHMESLRA